MTTNVNPNDIEAFMALLLERDVRIGHREDAFESWKASEAPDKSEIEHLKLLIAESRRVQFGRPSEKLDRPIEQLELHPEKLESDEPVASTEIFRTPCPPGNRRNACWWTTCRVRSRSICPNT